MDKFELNYHFLQSSTLSAPALSLTLDKPQALWRVVLLRLWLVVAMVLLAASIVAHMLIGLNNDHLDLLDQVRRLLAGGTPYVAFAEVNPPLIHMIYILPVIMANATGLPQAWILNCFTLALIGLSLVTCERLLKYSAAPLMTRRIALSAIALALVAASFIHQVFADRDHLMVVLVSPWLVLYSPLARRELIPMRWHVAAAFMAAIGFAIKPFFYVLYIASVGFNLFCGKSLRALMRQWEPYVVAGFAVLYVGVIYAFFFEYPNTMLPLAWNTYRALQWSWEQKWGVITNDLFAGYAVCGMIGALALLMVARRYYDSSITYLFTLLAAATLVYAIQGGWFYTQYTFIAIALVLAIGTGAKLIDACERITDVRARIGALIMLGGFLAVSLVTDFATPIVQRAMRDIQMQRQYGHPLENFDMSREAAVDIEAKLKDHPRFMFFTLNMRAVNLLKEGTPRTNVGRFDYLWPLPGVLALAGKPAQLLPYKRSASYLFDSIADDLEHNKPDMIINDVSPDKWQLPSGFNIVTWLKQAPHFVEIWKAYTRVDSIDTCTPRDKSNCAYEIYYRK